jgi:hypothetical protein
LSITGDSDFGVGRSSGIETINASNDTRVYSRDTSSRSNVGGVTVEAIQHTKVSQSTTGERSISDIVLGINIHSSAFDIITRKTSDSTFVDTILATLGVELISVESVLDTLVDFLAAGEFGITNELNLSIGSSLSYDLITCKASQGASVGSIGATLNKVVFAVVSIQFALINFEATSECSIAS